MLGNLANICYEQRDIDEDLADVDNLIEQYKDIRDLLETHNQFLFEVKAMIKKMQGPQAILTLDMFVFTLDEEIDKLFELGTKYFTSNNAIL